MRTTNQKRDTTIISRKSAEMTFINQGVEVDTKEEATEATKAGVATTATEGATIITEMDMIIEIIIEILMKAEAIKKQAAEGAVELMSREPLAS